MCVPVCTPDTDARDGRRVGCCARAEHRTAVTVPVLHSCLARERLAGHCMDDVPSSAVPPPPMAETIHAPSARFPTIDVMRGALLAAMLVVHVLSAHGTADQVNAMHTWFGVFLISAGFVWLSGFTAGLRPAAGSDVLRAVRIACQLVLVMVAYAVLLSLARHFLDRISDPEVACAAHAGWSPPLRFDDLGILLPIAIVQVLSLPARAGRVGRAIAAALSLGSLMLLGASAAGPREGMGGLLLNVLVRRSLTPFYSVCIFVALGLAGALAGAARSRTLLTAAPGRILALAGFAAALAIAVPAFSQSILDVPYRAGAIPGAAATILWWSVAILLFLRGLAALAAGGVARALSLLGRHSLFVFVLHDFLLDADAFARLRLHVGKGLPFVVAAAVLDLAILLAAAHALEKSGAIASAVRSLLLETSLPSGVRRSFPVGAGLALTAVLAVYTGAALARPRADVLIDDFESSDGCPHWWTFGPLSFQRATAGSAERRGHVLDISGRPTAASGTGIYLQQEIGALRTLRLDVRGYGPGSGRLRIELFDDDNGNWEIEKDPKTYEPLYDDRFVLEIPVDWLGWRQLALPASAFRDDNPGIGDDVFNPERDLTSGGLLEMQFLVSATSPSNDSVHLQIDNVRWTP
jgi:hypothetical protein